MVLTARNSREDVAECLRLGARDYLAKPFKDSQLLLRVARLLVWAKREGPAGAGA
jgi:two-component system OmpR family response regulator